MGVWQDDFHELPTGGAGEGVQGCPLSGRLRQRDAELKNRPARRPYSGKTETFFLICVKPNKLPSGF